MKRFKNIGFFGSCQVNVGGYFLTKEVREKYNINIHCSLRFFEYDPSYSAYIEGTKLDYSIFNGMDVLVIEPNTLDNEASSEKIIDYLKNKDVKIINTFLIKFPIYPLNWSGYGENKKDYLNWDGLDKIDYNERFKKCIESMRKNNIKSDLSTEITDFVENNFNKQLLFTHSLHPTNTLLYYLWKHILQHIFINIDDENINLPKEHIIDCWRNPFTSKMVNDLDIQIKDIDINDQFYVERWKEKCCATIIIKCIDHFQTK